MAICVQGIAQLDTSLSRSDVESMPRSREKVDALNFLSREFAFVKPSESLDLANEALRMALEISYKPGVAYAYRNLSNVFVSQESYSLGMEYLQNALSIFEETADSIGIANCYISLGHTFRKLEERNEELSYNLKAHEIFSSVGRLDRVGVTAHNLGETYLYMEEYDRAEELTRYAISINDSTENLAVLSSCYKVMGLLMSRRGDMKEAERYFQKVLELTRILRNGSQKFATVESMIQLARIKEIAGDKEAQLGFLLMAAEFCEENDLLSALEGIYVKLIRYFSNQRNSNKVQEYMADFDRVSAELTERDLLDRADLARNVINVYRLESEKLRLEEEAQQQKESIRRRNIGLALAIALLLLLAGVAIYVLRTNKRLSEQRQIIEQQNAHLENLNATKDKFFSIVAHDLRAPLNSLRAYSSFLVDHLEHVTKEELNEMGRELMSSTDNTLEMADNLITWARMQMKEFRLQPERLLPSELIAQVTSVYEKLAAKKKILLTTSIETDSSFVGDRGQLIFVIRNIVNNAIKFTASGGKIDIHAYDSGSRIGVSISDNGIGMSDEIKAQIFSITKTVEIPGTEGEKGTGLGLVLCQEFMALHHGEIKVESVEGEGTTFHVTMERNQDFS